MVFTLLLTLLLLAFANHQVRSQQMADDHDSLFCKDCPLECFVWCVRVSNTTSPCQLAQQRKRIQKDNANDQCLAMRCVNFYCGAPSAIYCNPDGTIERRCLEPGSPFEGVPSSSKCWQYFESQCTNSEPNFQGLDVEKTTPTLQSVVATPSERPPKVPSMNKCHPECPDECGKLCRMTMAAVAPCMAYSGDDDKSCSAAACRNSYCYAPHAYFCNEFHQIDMNCTTDEPALLFLHSPSEVCRRWYLSQCDPMQRILTPGIPKSRPPTTTPGIVVSEETMTLPQQLPLDEIPCPGGCPSKCGSLCTMTNAPIDPCTVHSSESPDAQFCPSERCYSSYCSRPHAYFCANNGQLDLECSTDIATLAFLNSSNEVCRNWYLDQCKVPETQTPETLAPTNDLCDAACPVDACGENFCNAIKPNDQMSSPCASIRVTEPTCAGTRCHNFYCNSPLAVFCNDDDGQVEWNCTTRSENVLNLLSSTGEECFNWVSSLCLPRRPAAEITQSPPEITLNPSGLSAVEICAKDCPSQCGRLCNMVNAIIDPCSAVEHDDSSCPVEKCHNFYCDAPFALFCTEDQQIDLNCTSDQGALAFINSATDECRQWIADQCRAKPKRPEKYHGPMRSLVKRDVAAAAAAYIRYPQQRCQDDCPVDECGTRLCQLVETIDAPCSTATRNVADECRLEPCRSLYCGAPLALFCLQDGSVDLNCTLQGSYNETAYHFVNSNSSECSSWFLRQCKQLRSKQTTPRQVIPTGGRPTRRPTIKITASSPKPTINNSNPPTKLTSTKPTTKRTTITTRTKTTTTTPPTTTPEDLPDPIDESLLNNNNN